MAQLHELLRMQTRADTNRPQCLKEGYRDFGNEVCTEISVQLLTTRFTFHKEGEL